MSSIGSKYLVLCEDFACYVLDMEQALAEHEKQTLKVMPIEPLLQKLDMEINPDIDISYLWSTLQNGLLVLEMAFVEGGEYKCVLKCQHLKKKLESGTQMLSLNINPNPELSSDQVWERISQYYFGGVLYIALKSEDPSSIDINYSSICLCAFRVNTSSNTLVLISKSLLVVDSCVIAMTPDFLEYRINTRYDLDCFIRAQRKVFSGVFASESKTCLWVHCFHKNKFVPIGGANTSVQGLYCFGSRTAVEFESFEGKTVGIYTYHVNSDKQNLKQRHKLSRLYFRF